MKWNWQQEEWPNFKHKKSSLEAFEQAFLRQSGVYLGSMKSPVHQDQAAMAIELLCTEAMKTSEIEGEMLNRQSVQSSIRRHFGLAVAKQKAPPAEQGIADLLVHLYKTFDRPLTHADLHAWNAMVTQGRKDLRAMGAYRAHADPMQIVSGPMHNPKVHFEAPPSEHVWAEMTAFVDWFNQTAPNEKGALPALARAGLAHLHFVSIHPFEDGNGRLARALAEKALAQSTGRPTLLALSQTIQSDRKAYYQALESNNQKMEITPWLAYFANVVLLAQARTLLHVDFLIQKTRLHDLLRGRLNARQLKAVNRMFSEGPGGFTGGLSAANYISITRASHATATRDLQGLVEIGALKKTGELKYTRYHLNLNTLPLELM
jgi:Fic family protein